MIVLVLTVMPVLLLMGGLAWLIRWEVKQYQRDAGSAHRRRR
jgi:hypothetical protein